MILGSKVSKVTQSNDMDMILPVSFGGTDEMLNELLISNHLPGCMCSPHGKLFPEA